MCERGAAHSCFLAASVRLCGTAPKYTDSVKGVTNQKEILFQMEIHTLIWGIFIVWWIIFVKSVSNSSIVRICSVKKMT